MRPSFVTAAVAVATWIAISIAPSAASAATYTVTNTNDVAAANPSNGCATPDGSAAGGACTLRSAVQAADAAGGSNSITLAAGDYKLTIAPDDADNADTGDLNVTGNDQLTITGAGASSTTIDANFIDRAFNVDSDGSALTLTGVTVTNGRPGGLGDITTCPDTSVANESDGGAILAAGPLTLTNDVITGNMAAGDGGGIAFETLSSPTMSITDTTISDDTTCDNENDAQDGGGIYESVNTGGTVTIDGSTIDGNGVPTDSGLGGGLSDEGQGGVTVVVTDSTVSNNTAENAGGLYAQGGEGPDTMNLVGDTLDGNTAENTNVLEAGPLNRNPDAGEARSAADAPAASELPADGGAIFTEGDTVSVVNSTIVGNAATDGGGIASGIGSTTISFSTVTGNTATGDVFGGGTSTGNLENIDSGTFTLDDSIVADGTSPSGAPTNCDGGGFTSDGNNLFDDTSDSGAQCNAVASDLVKPFSSFDLGSLADNGGPTETEALELGSPAIDAANESRCTSETTLATGQPPIDQRGVDRPQGPACDIGAFEFEEADVAVTASATPTTIDVGQQTTVTDTITNHGYSTDADVTFTDPASAKFTIDSATAQQGSCAHTSSTVSCQLGSLAVGATTEVTLVLTANSVGTLTLNSSVAGLLPDPNLTNNHATVPVTVVAAPSADVGLVKKASPTGFNIGSRTTFTLTVKNHGPSTDTDVVLTDKLPGGLRFDSDRTSTGKCSGKTKITCKLGTLKDGATATVKVVVTGTKTGKIRNTAHVTGALHDPNLKNNTSHATVDVSPRPCVEKLVFRTAYEPAEHVTTVKVYVDGQLRQTLHGSNLRTVTVKPVPMKGTYSVTVMFIVSPYQTVTATRTYRNCEAGPTSYSFPPQTNPGSS